MGTQTSNLVANLPFTVKLAERHLPKHPYPILQVADAVLQARHLRIKRA
jgi:hypothetical protein